MTSPPQPAIVLVEDNDEDLFLFKQLLVKARVSNKVLRLRDGAEAIKYFGRVAAGRLDFPLACFVDIKMPGYGGFEVLDAVRASEELDCIPVFMLSTSDDRRDILQSARKGAQCYLVKHPRPASLRALIDEAKEFSLRRGSAKSDLFKMAENLLPS
jgi:two-component system, response regulator